MSSVEELCDHITLINKSRNILSGKIDDIRNNYSPNRYMLTFNGDVTVLQSALTDFVTYQIESVPQSSDVQMFVDLKENTSLRDVITIANENVDIRSIVEVKPTINDIFIQAVNSSNQ